jgi:DNA-binding MarR family transcriptional regulator
LELAIGLAAPDYILYLVAHVTRRREAELAGVLDELGLTISHWRALAVTSRLGDCTMSDLADVTAVDRTTLTRTVDQLVQLGLVARTPSPGDRRVVRLSLTPAGVELVGKITPKTRELNARWLQGVPEEQRVVAIRMLQAVVGNLIEDEDVARGVLAMRHTHRRP